MKNTNTTLMQLSHKYASVLRKCAILNAMVFGIAIAAPVNAATITTDENENKVMRIESGEVYIPESYLDISKLIMDSGSTFYMPAGGLNISELNMDSTSFLNWNDPTNPENKYYGLNGINIDNANFSGKIDMGYATAANQYQPDHFIHVIHTTNTLFKDVTIIGNLNPSKEGKPNINWGDYSSFWSNQLTLEGTVNMSNTQVGMETESVKGPDFFRDENDDPYPAFDLYKSDYDNGDTVVWNGGLYTVDTTNTTKVKLQGTFSDTFFKNLADKVESGKLVSTNEMDQFTPLVSMGTTYKVGDVIKIVATNQYLKSVELIDDFDEGQGNALRTLVYEVKGSDVTTLTPTDVLTAKELPVEYESGVKISNAQVTLDHSSLSALQYMDPMIKAAQALEYTELYQKDLSTLTNLSEADQAVITSLGSVIDSYGFGSNPDAFWNILRDYDGDNEVIKKAYEDTDEIQSKYRNEATKPKNLEYTIENSTVMVGNNSDVQKGSSGQFLIDNSKITIWGKDDEVANRDGNEPGGSGLHHFGATGDMVIQGGSVVNIYSNGSVNRDGEQANIYVIGSTINMNGTQSMAGEEDATDGACMSLDSLKDGNIQLTQGSLLNVTGGENYVYSSNAGINLEDPDWQNKAKANALYVNGSQIVVNKDSSLEFLYYDVNRGSADHESEDGAVGGGTIALDLNSSVDLAGKLEANIVSLTPTLAVTDSITKENIGSLKLTENVGKVYLYDGAHLNGYINGANIYVHDKKTTLGGPLTIKGGAVLNLGTNLLKTTALSSNASLIETTISSADNYGALNVGDLTFEKSLIRVNMDKDLEKGQSIVIPFLTGDTAALTAEDFYNIKYKFEYKDGKLKLTRNGNSGIIAVDELNRAMSAQDAWSDPDSFASGSSAQIIAMRLNNLKNNNSEEFEKVVKKLKPADANQAQQVAGQTSQQVANQASGRMGGSGRYGNNGNGNHNGRGQGNGKGNNGNAYGLNKGQSGGDSFTNVGMWVQGLYNQAKLDTANGYKGKTKGIAMGMDGMATDNLKLGFGYAYSTTDIDADGSDTDVDTHTGMLYGEYTFGKAFVNLIGSYGYSSYDAARDVVGFNVKSDYHTDALYGQMMTGYNFDLTNISLTPETGLRYLWTKTHSYHESVLDQDVSSNITTTLTGVLGGRVGMKFETEHALFMPELKLATTYDMKNDKGSSSVRLANGSGYVVNGETLKRLGVETGAKVGMTIDNMDFSVSYEGKFKKDYSDHTGMLNFRYNF